MNACPQCKSSEVVDGIIPGYEGSQTDSFQPATIKLGARMMRNEIRLVNKNIFHACLNCGLTWSEVDQSELVSFLAKQCNP
jgi:hypothetical protein